MSVCFNRQSNEVKVGYFGKLYFIDNKKYFEKMFGDKPTIFPPNPMSQDSSTVMKIPYLYIEKCKLDVFLLICRKYYVGANSVDNSLSTQDVCCPISYLIQDLRDRDWCTIRKSPDDLLNTILKISSSLLASDCQ